MSYYIVCDARKGIDIGVNSLFLVDRAKSKPYWWVSDDLSIAMEFEKRSAAEYSLRRLKRNNPIIVEKDEAIMIVKDQIDCLAYHAGMSCQEDGWDGHKS